MFAGVTTAYLALLIYFSIELWHLLLGTFLLSFFLALWLDPKRLNVRMGSLCLTAGISGVALPGFQVVIPPLVVQLKPHISEEAAAALDVFVKLLGSLNITFSNDGWPSLGLAAIGAVLLLWPSRPSLHAEREQGSGGFNSAHGKKPPDSQSGGTASSSSSESSAVEHKGRVDFGAKTSAVVATPEPRTGALVDGRGVGEEKRREPKLVGDNFVEAGISSNGRFCGRKADLESITHVLKGYETQRLLLTGLGGIGKTQIALAYMFNPGIDVVGRWWLDGEPSRLHQGLLNLIQWLRPCTAEESASLERCWCGFVTMLGDGMHLVVIDDIPGDSSVLGLPITANVRIIATTRQANALPEILQQEVDVLEDAECASLIWSHRGETRPTEDGPTSCEVLARELGGHPFAAATLGAYWRANSRLSGNEVLTLLRETEITDPESILNQVDRRLVSMSYAKTLLQSLSLQLAQFDGRLPEQIMRALSVCYGEAIADQFLCCVMKDEKPQRIQEALRDLRDCSLIKYDAFVSIHRLMQSVVRGRMTQNELEQAKRSVIVGIREWLRTVRAGSSSMHQVMVHTSVLQSQIPMANTKAAARIGGLLRDVARTYAEHDPVKAKFVLKEAIGYLDAARVSESRSVELCEAYQQMAELCERDDIKEALTWWREAEDHALKSFGEESSVTSEVRAGRRRAKDMAGSKR